MLFIFNDGGRSNSGYKGKAGDCVCRSISIVSGIPYSDVYDYLACGAGKERRTKGRSARDGINTSRKWFKSLMKEWGFVWTPTMHIGSGCIVHLDDNELPNGRLVVSLSKHYTAVIDGIIYDTFNPQRTSLICENGVTRIVRRCVYGYWKYR